MYQWSSCCSFCGPLWWCTLRFYTQKQCSVRLYTHLCCLRYMFHYCYLYLFMHTVPFLCQMIFLSFNSNKTGLDVEKELVSLPEHMCSHPISGGVLLGALSLVFCVVICRPVFCVVICRPLFFLFPLVIVLSVLLFTAFDYPFGIFKLFFLELLQIILQIIICPFYFLPIVLSVLF